MTTDTRQPQSLERRAAALMEELVAFADQAECHEAAALLRQFAERNTGSPDIVVVAGRVKCGKSSLINTFVGRPGLLPVDQEVATDVGVRVVHAPDPYARVELGVYVPGTADQVSEIRDITLDEVAEYAAVDPQSGRARHDNVVSVEVGVPDPLLAAGMQIYDTPGLYGPAMLYFHADTTLGMLQFANILVYVCDGRLDDPELHLLAEAAAHLTAVVFVQSKADLNTGTGPDLLQENRRRLGLRVPAFADAPWLSVSCAAEGSGIAQLRHVLGAVHRSRPQLRDALQQATETLVSLDSDLADRQQELLDPTSRASAEAAIQAELDQLARLDTEPAQWLTTVQRHLAQLHAQAPADLDRRVADLGTILAERLERGELTVDGAYQQLQADLTQAVNAVNTTVRRTIAQTIAGLLPEELFAPEHRTVPAGQAVRAPGGVLSTRAAATREPPDVVERAGQFIQDNVAPYNLGRYLAPIIRAALLPYVTVPAPAIGLAVYAVVRYRQYRQQQRVERRAQANELRSVAAQARESVWGVLRPALASQQATVQRHLTTAIDSARAAGKERLESLRRAGEQSEAERRIQLDRIAVHRQVLGDLQDRTGRLLDDLAETAAFHPVVGQDVQ